MPAAQRGQVDRIEPGRWRCRYYDRDGKRHSKQPFPSKTAAWKWYREHVEPELTGQAPARPEIDLSAFVGIFLERHSANVRSRTIATLTERLRHAERALGAVPLRDLERMSDEIAGWASKQPSGARHGRTSALRQALDAAQRWGYIAQNPAKLAGPNPKTPPRIIRAFDRAELDAIAIELSPCYAPLPIFAAATGLRPEEWQALERRDIDRQAGILNVRRTVSSGDVVELAKTSRSRRQVPLSARALAALDALPPRLDTPLLFPAQRGGVLNLDNWRSREWSPAVEAAGVATPARIYDMRSTFASNAIAAGVSLFELAKIMGTSVAMIESAYGVLLDGSGAAIASRLDAFEAQEEGVPTVTSVTPPSGRLGRD